MSKEPVIGNGMFLHGDANLAAQIKLPLSMVSLAFNPVNDMFKRIRAEKF